MKTGGHKGILCVYLLSLPVRGAWIEIDICKKIDQMREESLVGLQISGKNNPMCYMPSLNKYCGFNMPGVRDQGARARALTASELPKLGGGNCARLPDNFDNSSPDNGEIVIDNSNNLKPSV